MFYNAKLDELLHGNELHVVEINFLTNFNKLFRTSVYFK